MDVLELCEDCRHAIMISEDPGFSPRECGLPSRCITYLDGCKKDLEPHYNSDEESIECDGYEMRRGWDD